ncbi:MAG: hypothetical protein FJ319_08390 [SAR202 cluster bacterium]|nr:hypothetical protein [SAR202 cluster bacterium]
MNSGLTFFKALGAFFLGVVVLAGYGYCLWAAVFNETMESPQTIYAALDRHDAYNRMYEQVLISDDFALARSIDVAYQMSDEEKRQMLRQIMPPDYVRQETESVINAVLVYLKDGQGTPEVSLDLKTPMSLIKPAVFALIDRRIDAAELVRVDSQAEFAAEIGTFLTSTASGIIPDRIPSLEGLSPEEAAQIYHQRIDDFASYGGASTKTLEALQASRDQAAAAIRSGDVRGGVKAAAKAVADPRIDGVVSELRNVLDGEERLDLLGWVAEQIGAPNKAKRDARSARLWVKLLVDYGSALALVLCLAAAVGILALFRPYLWHGLLWAGVALIAVGAVYLVGGIVQAMDLGFWDAIWCGGSGCSLVMDVISTVAAEAADVVINYSAGLIIVGAVCAFPAWLMITRAKGLHGGGGNG